MWHRVVACGWGGGLWQGVGACDKSCGNITGEGDGDMWQGWGQVAGMEACGRVLEHLAGSGGSGSGYVTMTYN